MTYRIYSILGILLGIGSTGFALIVTFYLSTTYRDPNQVETDQINQQLPRDLKNGVSLDKATYDEHANRFSYNYTVQNSKVQWFLSHRDEQEQTLRTYYHDHLQAVNNRGTSVHWVYFDSSGKKFCEIVAYSDYPGHSPDIRLQDALDKCGQITGFGCVIFLASSFSYWVNRQRPHTINKNDEQRVLSYFNGPLQQYTNAAKEGDFAVIATGAYKLIYPLLYVGESHFNIENSRLTDDNTLVLQDGTKFNFY